MTAQKNINNKEQAAQGEPTNQVNKYRWIIGLAIMLVGIYAVLASVSYLFNWKADCSLLLGIADTRPDIVPTYGNICRGFGAFVGDLLVGRSFGLVGIIIPGYLLLLGYNIIRGSKRLILNRDTLTMFIILILTSLTLGAIFGTSWDLFGTGLGGAFGVQISRMLYEIIGVGLILVLIGAWAAVGVFINSNFINVVNRAGSSALSTTDKLFSMLKKDRNSADNQEDEQEDDDNFIESDEQPSTQPIALAQEPKEEVKAENEVAEIRQVVEIDVDSANLTAPLTVNDVYAAKPIEVVQEPVPELIMANAPTELEVAKEDKVITQQQPAEDDSQPSGIAPVSIAEDTAEQALDPKDESDAEYDDEDFDEDNPFIEVIRSVKKTPIEEAGNAITPKAEGDNGAIVFVEVNKATEVSESEIAKTLYDPTKDINNYIKPPVSLLEDYQLGVGVDDAEIFENKSKIEETLNHFGIPIQQHIKATVGPTITLYEIVQANGVKISKIQGLENDIAQRLKALGIRIIAPIPGAGTIGVELPNRKKQIVSMRSVILSPEFQNVKAQLPVVIGRTIQNGNYVFDLAKMPHLLVAGATGQGKSVGLNAIITSLLYSKHPSELKFVMIDPKMVEFSPYKKLENHYMAKMESEEDVIITDPRKAVYALNSICEEMENRLKLLSQAGVRNIVEYNEKFRQRMLNPEKGHFFMPYIVVIIDEFADLIMTAKEVEMPVMRIAQKARAVGIHLIVATQRPDVKVITGGIKANFPARIAFKVTQMIDSRTIIDQPGANQLIGRGDMLFSKDGELTRIQCALVETEEVVRIVDHIGNQQGYSAPYPLPDYAPESGSGGDFDSGASGSEIKYDSLFAEIARAAVSNGGMSTSAIQRNFEVGFNRAGRIMSQMERAGIVGRQEGSKPREILYHDLPSLEAKLQELGLF
ncbi:MAG: DNA translocase FtsK [Rikenellaceae bacterium]